MRGCCGWYTVPINRTTQTRGAQAKTSRTDRQRNKPTWWRNHEQTERDTSQLDKESRTERQRNKPTWWRDHEWTDIQASLMKKSRTDRKRNKPTWWRDHERTEIQASLMKKITNGQREKRANLKKSRAKRQRNKPTRWRNHEQQGTEAQDEETEIKTSQSGEITHQKDTDTTWKKN